MLLLERGTFSPTLQKKLDMHHFASSIPLSVLSCEVAFFNDENLYAVLKLIFTWLYNYPAL